MAPQRKGYQREWEGHQREGRGSRGRGHQKDGRSSRKMGGAAERWEEQQKDGRGSRKMGGGTRGEGHQGRGRGRVTLLTSLSLYQLRESAVSTNQESLLLPLMRDTGMPSHPFLIT